MSTAAARLRDPEGPLEGAVLPDFGGACVASLVPALLGAPAAAPSWLPRALAGAEQVVLFIVDGLGAEQLEERRSLTPVMGEMERTTLTTVAPSTTATVLTSITTGLAPSEHGILGYRLAEGDGVLNVLRWRVGDRDARVDVDPRRYQPAAPFLGRTVPVVSRRDFAGTGFTEAHLRGATLAGWSVPSSIAVEVGRLLAAGEPFIYAYYDGLDKVAHDCGLDAHYDAELAAVDRLVGELRAALPAGAALAVSADHGEIELAAPPIDLVPAFGGRAVRLSGEGRFRWVHAAAHDVDAIYDALVDELGERAFVTYRDELFESGLFGGPLRPEFASRVGDLAVIARERVAFLDPGDPGERRLVGRHGSLSPAEMYVPLLAGRG